MAFKNRSVNVHEFAMAPRADIPRSSFRIQTAHKTTFDNGWLIPIYVDEVLPGDSFHLQMTAFTRMATPLFPIMDNLHLDSFFFFVPNRLIWDNWKRFMGEQDNPGSSTSFLVPQVVFDKNLPQCSPGSIYDFMGMPMAATGTVSVNALPFRAYHLIYNEWFRDENLINSVAVNKGDGPDGAASYALWRRGKRHDYFTSCLPFLQKGTSVTLPLGTSAPVIPDPAFGPPPGPVYKAANNAAVTRRLTMSSANSGANWSSPPGVDDIAVWSQSGLIADLSTATAATINQIRQSFQIQKLLERDARGGTRYTELVRSHFGVVSPDARLQRPEYLGGGSSPINFTSVPQNAPDAASPIGRLAAFATGVAPRHGFSQSFTEHGYIIGLVSVRADLTYQQGLRKLWSRRTRYDYYFPVFAALGEQAVLNKEIYCQGDNVAADSQVFGYQERWAEYRYNPSMITGAFRSTHATPLDAWHLAQRFTALPVLGSTFISENAPISRVVAAGAASLHQEFLFDSFFDIRCARAMPMYSVPGMVDHF